MALTSIGQQKTPGRPVEITFDAETGLPSDAQSLNLIGHAATGATGVNTVVTINNVSDVALAQAEAETKFGVGSELAKMVVAAVTANQGGSTFPAIKCTVLDNADTTIAADAQTAIKRKSAEFLVSPYNLNSDATNRDIVKALALAMSGAQRVQNLQFGTFGVGADQSEPDPSLLFKFDTQFLIGCWLPDTDPAYSVGELAAACAAKMAANNSPFNPLDDVTVGGVTAPADDAEWPTVGAGLESESCLNQGWTPLFVKPNTEVAFVRTVTGRLSADGTGAPVVTSYYDVQDFQVLYFFRKTVFTRFSQPDFKNKKASNAMIVAVKGTAVGLAETFETQDMFQNVGDLAPSFECERNISDRHRIDLKIPVNVIPGLHVIASNIVAGTRFDIITV